jgi:O-antigen ligase
MGNQVAWNPLIWSVIYIFSVIRLGQMWPQVRVLAPKALLLGAFCGLMVVSTVWSVAPYRTLSNSIELFGSALFGLYLVIRFPLPDLLRILLYKFASLAAASYVLIVFAPVRGRVDWGGGAWSGVYAEKNGLGAEAVLALIIIIALWPATTKARLLALVGAAPFAVLLAGSSSATAYAACFGAFLIVAVVLICRSPKTSNAMRFGIVGVVVVAALSIVVFGVTPDAILGLLGRSSSLTGRTNFWPYLQQAVASRPLLGFGYDAFFGSEIGSQFLASFVFEQAGGWYPFHAHNSFLQIALDAGYVGVALFAVVYVKALFQAVRYCFGEPQTYTVWPMAILLFLLFGCWTESTFAMWNTDGWVLFVAATLYPRVRRTVTVSAAQFARGKVPRSHPAR